MKAVSYIRTSTLDQAREEKVSIPDQLKWAKTFALEKGWEWVQEYIEPGVTGDTEPEDREALSRLLNDAKDDKFDILLVYHSSRLAREPDIGMRVCRMLGQLRKQVYFRNAPIDPVSPDKFSWGQNVGAQYMTAFSFIGDFQENVARSERVRSGFQGLAKRGVLVFAPYGYKKIGNISTDENGRQRYTWMFEIDPQKALIVRRIFNDYVKKAMSLRQIMLTFNREKISSPSGTVSDEAWSPATIKNILTNPTYIGKVRWGRKLGGKYLQGKSFSGKQRRTFTLPESWILVEGDHPKIIEETLFSLAGERLKLRYVLKGRAVASGGLLVGIVRCGRCGRNAYYKTIVIKKKNNLVRSDYCCQSYVRSKTCQRHIISAKKLHEIVLSELDKIISNKKYRKKFLEKNGNGKNNSLIKELDLLKQERKQIEGKQQRILRAYEAGVLPLEEFGSAKRRLDEEELSLIGNIDKIEKALNDKSREKEMKKKFLHILSNFKKSFQKAEFKKQKELLHSLIESIFVKKESIKINYRV